MIKGKDILGRHIVAIDSGQRIDSVHDLIFDHQANEVLGLLVDEGGWFRAAKVVPFEMIRCHRRGRHHDRLGAARDHHPSR